MLGATTVVEGLLVISTCILKRGVSQNTTPFRQYYALFGNTRRVFLKVPAHFYDVTDDEIWMKKARRLHLNHSFMCSTPKNSYLSCEIYSDTSVELVKVRVALTKFWTCSNLLLQLLNL